MYASCILSQTQYNMFSSAVFYMNVRQLITKTEVKLFTMFTSQITCLFLHEIMSFYFLQTLKKVRKYLEEQNQNIYISRGVMIVDPAERGLRIVSFGKFL